MTARVIPLHPVAPDPGFTLEEELRALCAEALDGALADSTLIACMVGANDIERGIIIRELEQRGADRRATAIDALLIEAVRKGLG